MVCRMINTDHMILRRYAKRMTQRELAEKMGMTTKHICRLEKGRMTPKVSTLLRLCQLLETEPNRILLWSKKEG